MKFVLIMTDSQNRDMVGAYGTDAMRTPHLDRFAASAIRFDRAYNVAPACTTARGGIFTGMHPQVNGAYTNNVAPHRNVPMMGEILRHYGHRPGYTGKWHLDGSGYFGDGVPGGGFEAEWWFDGARYLASLSPAQAEFYAGRHADVSAADLARHGFEGDRLWGRGVADRAIDFLRTVPDDDFALVVSFDEPHHPYFAPPEYWEAWRTKHVHALPRRENYCAPLTDKPALQQWQAQNIPWPQTPASWAAYRAKRYAYFACNEYVDSLIGEVLAAVETHHGDDVLVVYTADHGDMLGSHQLHAKGPMMYEEIANVPFIVRPPGLKAGRVSRQLASHVDILPTMLDYMGVERPPSLHGVSLKPALEDAEATARDTALISWTRFGINHDAFGEFYPIRCMTDGRYKLSINLFETDEFYDLKLDPYERVNRIDDPATAYHRNRLHVALLDEMDRIRDTARSSRWRDRPWAPRATAYFTAPERDPPSGFDFQARTASGAPARDTADIDPDRAR